MSNKFACIWRSGLIELLDHLPEGAYLLAEGAEADLTQRLDGAARLSKPRPGQDPVQFQEQWLCPGVPEARDDDAAAGLALLDFAAFFRGEKRKPRLFSPAVESALSKVEQVQ